MATVYVIGGPPRCGKTTAAEMLSKRLQIPWMPTDYIGKIVDQYLSVDHRRSHPLAYLRQTTHKNNDLFYTDFSSEEIIKMYRDKAVTVWPGLRAFIEYAIHEKRSFIIEGLHIDPALISELLPSHDIACVMLYRTDARQIEEGFRKSTEEHDWVLEHTKEQTTFPKIAQMIAEYGEIIQKESAKKKIDPVCLDGDFETQLSKALELLTKN